MSSRDKKNGKKKNTVLHMSDNGSKSQTIAEKLKGRGKSNGNSRTNNYIKKLKYLAKSTLNLDALNSLIFSPTYFWIAAIVFLLAEILINIYVIENVKYTEIDWKAYMQEVGGFLNGTLDYTQLKGDTGPLVYPAGFLYFFSILSFITNGGKNVYLAQYIFAGIYIGTLALVFRLFHLSKKIPPYVLFFICLTSYRIHSLFVLRLFNDTVAMLFLYAALNLFVSRKWSVGSIFFSLAVSVKMNVLLYAPALLMAYLYVLGVTGTIVQLSICAAIQVVLALPFLIVNAHGYVWGAFDFGRVFLYEWTVNWKFLPEEIFLCQKFHLGLLALHVCVLIIFAAFHWKRLLQHYGPLQGSKLNVSCQLFLLPMFISNFIGIVFSRSLHYQFYVWYYHTLHYLLWSTKLSVKLRILILGVIELCWTIFPAQWWSSLALLVCHLVCLVSLFENRPTQDRVEDVKKKIGKAQ